MTILASSMHVHVCKDLRCTDLFEPTLQDLSSAWFHSSAMHTSIKGLKMQRYAGLSSIWKGPTPHSTVAIHHPWDPTQLECEGTESVVNPIRSENVIVHSQPWTIHSSKVVQTPMPFVALVSRAGHVAYARLSMDCFHRIRTAWLDPSLRFVLSERGSTWDVHDRSSVPVRGANAPFLWTCDVCFPSTHPRPSLFHFLRVGTVSIDLPWVATGEVEWFR